jgi:hypothetical protein
VAEGNYSITIPEQPYNKDPFEIPVFEYMIQGNDDYSANGNVVISNDLFSTFTGDVDYKYVIYNTTRFTAENADSLFFEDFDGNTGLVTLTRSGASDQIIDMDLFVNSLALPLVRNASLIKNVGIYAKVGASVKFLFAINDYVESGANDKSNIRLYINNWKI